MVTRNAISAPTGAATKVYTGQGVGSRPTWVAPAAAAGDVTAAANLTDHYVVRGDGGAKGVQTSTMVIDDSGQMLNPSQPAFSAMMSAARTNVTGDGTSYTVACNVEIFDQNSDYDNGTYTFTAPVTGRYQFFGHIVYSTLGATTLVNSSFVSSNRTYYTQFSGNKQDATNRFGINSSIQADMDVSDTIYMVALASGTTKTVGVTYSSTTYPLTVFAGNLIC